MYEISELQANDYADISDATGFDPETLTAERADQHLAVIDDRQRIRARCSIWWRDTASIDNARVGAIGHYAADCSSYGSALLERACRELKARRCGHAIGPMDGNTWRHYRFVTERGTAKPFFLEPDNPDQWPDHFAASGFQVYANYVSELNPNFHIRQPGIGGLRQKFDDLRVTIEPIDLSRAAEEVQGLYEVVCESFADSLLYTPLEYDDFAAMYMPFLGMIDSRLILVARHENRVVGFVFSPPDYLQSGNAGEIDTIVIKTVAILPRKKYSGLGRVLLVDLLKNAQAMGYRQAISALMHAENRSQKISSNCAGPMRGYQLFARALRA